MTNILLIEDDAWFAEQQERTLRAAGFMVHRAGDGLEAIGAIDRLRPDVLVLDVFLPGPNGLVLVHEIKSHSDLVGIPIILCTSSAADLSPEWVKAYGVVSIIDKTTMHPQDMVAAIKRVIA